MPRYVLSIHADNPPIGPDLQSESLPQESRRLGRRHKSCWSPLHRRILPLVANGMQESDVDNNGLT